MGLKQLLISPPRWFVALAGTPCIHCGRKTLAAVVYRLGRASFKIPVCEPCHQAHHPDIAPC